MATTWVLILVIEGWGSGIGSTGNGLAVAEFTTQARCIAAIQIVRQLRKDDHGAPVRGACLEK